MSSVFLLLALLFCLPLVRRAVNALCGFLLSSFPLPSFRILTYCRLLSSFLILPDPCSDDDVPVSGLLGRFLSRRSYSVSAAGSASLSETLGYGKNRTKSEMGSVVQGARARGEGDRSFCLISFRSLIRFLAEQRSSTTERNETCPRGRIEHRPFLLSLQSSVLLLFLFFFRFAWTPIPGVEGMVALAYFLQRRSSSVRCLTDSSSSLPLFFLPLLPFSCTS